MTLKSHPDRSLKQHVQEVRQAAEIIWKQHSKELKETCADCFNWLMWAVSLHDVGKGSAEFQVYINDVKNYKGAPEKKAHTPMSFATAIGYGRRNAWDWQKTLAVAQSAIGHHSSFRDCDYLKDVLARIDIQSLLLSQLPSFDWKQVNKAVLHNFNIEPIKTEFDSDLELVAMSDWLEDEVFPDQLNALQLADGLEYRLRCQLIFSILLEADKAFLIVKEKDRHKFRSRTHKKIPVKLVSNHLERETERRKRSKRTPPSATQLEFNKTRSIIRRDLLKSLEQGNGERVQTMTLPTGSGKTLLSATWALFHREKRQSKEHTPPIVIVLPFLSIIDQTHDEYKELLTDRHGLISFHSLSERTHDLSGEEETAEFFLDTWHGDVIITTYDQLLYAMLSPKSKFQMRFHQLCDAIIVMDEVQALPCILWDIVSRTIEQLTQLGNTQVLAMSATQTGFLPFATELVANPKAIFRTLNRYEIDLSYLENQTLDQFTQKIMSRLKNWKNERVLIVLNTRGSARHVRDAIANKAEGVEFISADVTPLDRRKVISRIKEAESCIVVSTQCIEAGVDIDMTLVIRDFAPLDSIIQVAGRCNRHNARSVERVEVVSLVNDKNTTFASMVYQGKVELQETRRVINQYKESRNKTILPETDVYDLTENYFCGLREKKNLGEKYTEEFSKWKPMNSSIQELLRGKNQQYSFVVIEQDPDLEVELERINEINERWPKRRALRNLAARIAAVSVSVYTTKVADPELFARKDPTGTFWFLNKGNYFSERGLVLDSEILAGSVIL